MFLHRAVTGEKEHMFYDNPKKLQSSVMQIIAIALNMNTLENV